MTHKNELHDHDHDDELLVAQVLRGEREAFNPLARRHYASVVRFAQRLLGASYESQDVAQEALLQSFLGLAQLHEPARYGAWLHGIAANIARMTMRRRSLDSLERVAHDEPMLLLWGRPAPAPDHVALAREVHDAIIAALDELSQVNREVAIGYFFDGYSYAELAELLHVPLSTVKGRLFKTRRQLQQTLAPHAPASLSAYQRAALAARPAQLVAGALALDVALSTPAGTQLRRLLEALNSGQAEQVRTFLAEHCPPGGEKKLRLRTRWFVPELYERTRGLDVMSIEESTPTSLKLLAKARQGGDWFRMLLEVTPAPPHTLIVEETRLLGATITPGMHVEVSGAAMAVHVEGSGGPTVLFEPRADGHSGSWGALPTAIAQYTTVCRYDRAGVGWSDSRPKPRSFHDSVEDLDALLELLDLPRPYIFVGQGVGGLLARLYTERYPDQVFGMVLANSNHPEYFQRTLATLPPEDPHEPAAIQQLRSYLLDPFSTAEWDDWLSCFAQARACVSLGDRPLIVLTSSKNMSQAGDMPPDVAARLNALWFALQAELAQLSSHSKQLFAEQSGFYIQHDQPELLIGAIEELLALARAETRSR